MSVWRAGTWHSEEMPTAEELAAAEERLTQSGGVDLIITHQPSDRMRIFLGGDRTEISPLGAFLDRVEQEMQFGSWYFGRLHKDKKIPPPAAGGIPGGSPGRTAVNSIKSGSSGEDGPLFFHRGRLTQKNSAAAGPRRFFPYGSELGQITYLPSAAGRAEGSAEIVKVMAKPSFAAVASSRSIIFASSVRSSPAIFRVWSTKISVVS